MNDQLTLDVNLRADESFENFVMGENQQLVEVLKGNSGLGKGVFLWGATGLGKSHLLNALCQHRQQQFPEQRVAYIPLGGEISFPADSLLGLEACQLVAIDNIDAVLVESDPTRNVSETDEWQRALFHLINRLHDQQATLVVTSSKALKHIEVSLPDLASRLANLTLFELRPLNDEQCLVALAQGALQRGIKLEAEVLNYVAQRGPRDMGKLMDLLERLDQESLKAKRVITIPFIKQFVQW